MKNLTAFLGICLLAVLALSGCCAEGSCNVPEPERYGAIKIALGPSLDGTPDWRPDQIAAFRPLERELDSLGPDFILVPMGTPASVVIRPATLPAGTCGRYRLDETYVEVDPACTPGYLALRKAAAHEIMHAVLWQRFRWAKHICWFPLNQPVPAECHPTIVCRDCLLSPGLITEDTWGDRVEDYIPGVSFPEPQAQDIQLFRRCLDSNSCE